MDHDAIADDRLEKWDARVLEVGDVDLQVQGKRELGGEAEEIRAGGQDSDIDVGVRPGPAAGARAEEQGDVYTVVIREGTSEGADDFTRRHGARA